MIMPKPVDSIARIANLMQGCEVNVLEKNDRLAMNYSGVRYVVSLQSGIATWDPEEKEDNTLSGVWINAPHVVGLGALRGASSQTGFLTAMTTCVYRMLPEEAFTEACTGSQLWMDVSLIMGWQIAGLTTLLHASSRSQNHHRVLALLTVLAQPEHDFIRRHVSMCDYIVSKSTLSRSTVMSILSGFIRLGIIDAHRGKLLKLANTGTSNQALL